MENNIYFHLWHVSTRMTSISVRERVHLHFSKSTIYCTKEQQSRAKITTTFSGSATVPQIPQASAKCSSNIGVSADGSVQSIVKWSNYMSEITMLDENGKQIET